MDKPLGFIYGTATAFRWLLRQRNGRLMALAVVVFLVPPQLFRVLTNLASQFAHDLGNFAAAETINTVRKWGLGLSLFICTLTACVLIVFSGWRACRDYLDRECVNPPAPTPDGPSETN